MNDWPSIRHKLNIICRKSVSSMTVNLSSGCFPPCATACWLGASGCARRWCTSFCRLCGGQWQQADSFAAAVEMVHTYSLIHDDLPCMDNDDFRRGQPTNHKVYGEATAVLAGDALLTAAFGRLACAAYPAEARIRAVEVLSSCAGELGMVGGQMLDMLAEERACTAQEILDIQTRKTGALIRSACLLGVIAGSGSRQQEGGGGRICHPFWSGVSDSGRYVGRHWRCASPGQGGWGRWGQKYLSPALRPNWLSDFGGATHGPGDCRSGSFPRQRMAGQPGPVPRRPG